MFPESPIDTTPYMRDLGQGYPQLDLAPAWGAARALYNDVPDHVRKLYERLPSLTLMVQDRHCDLPWPDATDEDRALQAAFRAIDEATLKRAASVIHALGHWYSAAGARAYWTARRESLPVRTALDGLGQPVDRTVESGVEIEDRLWGGKFTHGAYWRFARYAEQSIRERHGRPWPGAEPRPPTPLEAMCTKRGMAIECEYGAPEGATPIGEAMTGWTVTLKYSGRKLTVPFWQGAAHEDEPTAADVLSCLLSDAGSIASADGFEDWASGMGYDADSRKALATYKACQRIDKGVRRLLGRDFGTFERASAEH